MDERNPQENAPSYLDPRTWLGALIRGIIRPRPKSRLWRWLDRWVVVPEEAGGPCTGRLRTGRVPIFRGLYDLCQQRHVHFLTLVASARVGKTLFSICILLYWLGEKFGHVVWLDPTRKSAVKLVRTELEQFLLQCEPVRELAIISRKDWTTLEKSFRGKLFRIVASGAEADLHGFNAELAVINERDRCRASIDRDAASYDKIVARTKLFAKSRLVIDNSTPGEGGELSPTWQDFLKRSQHYCYLPCPHCSRPEPGFVAPAEESVEAGRSALSYDPGLRGWQRLSFFIDKKLVPFDEDLQPILGEDGKTAPREKWREEITGQFEFGRFAIYEDRPCVDDPTRTEKVKVGYDGDAVEEGTGYECQHCKQIIEWVDLPWMLDRYRWIPHNPFAPKDKISAHVWAGYNPFEYWGLIAKEFIEAKGNLSQLIKFWNFTLGLPFIREASVIKESDIDRAVARTPIRYIQGQIPAEAELLTVTVDKQGTQYWFLIRAWGILWDHPDWPTWTALIDWGEAVSKEQIQELCGHRPDAAGRLRKFKFVRPDGTEREYTVLAGLMDSGFEAEDVYEFCLANSAIWSPSKGGDASKTRGNPIRLSPIMDDLIDLVWYWSDYFAANLYYDCIKDGETMDAPVHWWLPTNTDKHYRTQLTDESQIEENGRRTWDARTKNNHLGDCEKLQRVFAGKVERLLEALREERRLEQEAKEKADKANTEAAY